MAASSSSEPKIMSFQTANVSLQASSFTDTFDNQNVLVYALRYHQLFTVLTKSASITIPLPLVAAANKTAVAVNNSLIQFEFKGVKYNISEDDFRNLFDLPRSEGQVSTLSDDVLLKTINEYMGHNPPIGKVSDFRKSRLSPLYQSLVQIVLKCLTGKTSGMDQLNRNYYILIHGIVTNE